MIPYEIVRAPNGSHFSVTFDADFLAQGWRLDRQEILETHRDGREAGLIIKHLIRHALQGEPAPKQSRFSGTCCQGRTWQVRVMTRNGLSFAPSHMKGKGRAFEASGFIEHINSVDRFMVVDVAGFPEVHFWILIPANIEELWKKGLIDQDGKADHSRARSFLQRTFELPDCPKGRMRSRLAQEILPI